jgi:hypothetical protein
MRPCRSTREYVTDPVYACVGSFYEEHARA